MIELLRFILLITQIAAYGTCALAGGCLIGYLLAKIEKEKYYNDD